MGCIKGLLVALLISDSLSSIVLSLSTEPAFSQVKQESALEILQGIFRPRRRPAGTRGPICLITPGLKPEWVSLSEIPFILSDRPLFVWQKPVTRVEVRLAPSGTVVWQQSLPPDRRRILYQGTPLQPSQTYQVVAFGRRNDPLNIGEDAQFSLVSPAQRTQIISDLTRKEAELSKQNRPAEEIAIAKAIDLSKRSLLSDAFQILDAIPNRSPQLNSFLTDIAAKACGQ